MLTKLQVAEPLVQRQGADRIVVELPGIQDTARAERNPRGNFTATLNSVWSTGAVDPAAIEAGRIRVTHWKKYTRDGRKVALLQKRVILTGDHVLTPNSGSDEYGQPQVSISLDKAPVKCNTMSDFTKDNLYKYDGDPVCRI